MSDVDCKTFAFVAASFFSLRGRGLTPHWGAREEKKQLTKTKEAGYQPASFRKRFEMKRTKSAFGRRALSVCIVSRKSVYVQLKNRDHKLPAKGWQMVSMPDGPIWIRRSETGELMVTDEPP